MPRSSTPTRDRIIAAAAKLFYGEGIRSVSVDAVAEAAGLTKRTLYYHFRSKDELIAAYLQAHDQPTLALFQRWFRECNGGVEDKVAGLFRAFAAAATAPKWRGCGFLRTTAELASTPGHPAVQAGAAHKRRFEAWLAGELSDAGVPDAALIARQILVLLDGAASVMLVHRDPAYVEAAGAAAASLVSGKSQGAGASKVRRRPPRTR